jgi:hypothetical protein
MKSIPGLGAEGREPGDANRKPPWFADEALHPRAGPDKPPMTMAALPPECRRVVLEE